jgi:hypothetical protein
MCTDVSDINIEILFKELWNNAKIADFFYMNPEFERQIPSYSAPKKYNTGFWYHDGRSLKIDLTNLECVNYTEYDICNGEGKFMEVVSSLRERELNFYG